MWAKGVWIRCAEFFFITVCEGFLQRFFFVLKENVESFDGEAGRRGFKLITPSVPYSIFFAGISVGRM